MDDFQVFFKTFFLNATRKSKHHNIKMHSIKNYVKVIFWIKYHIGACRSAFWDCLLQNGYDSWLK